MKNIRVRSKEPRPDHEDFDWMKSTTPPHKSTAPLNPKFWRKYSARIREGWDFAICLWGAVGREEDVFLEMPGQRLIIRDTSDHGKVREIMREIDYASLPTTWMGAPNVYPEHVFEKYEEKKQEWIATNRL
jgi:hypothetical protein